MEGLDYGVNFNHRDAAVQESAVEQLQRRSSFPASTIRSMMSND
jgi:hypothetical protein